MPTAYYKTPADVLRRFSAALAAQADNATLESIVGNDPATVATAFQEAKRLQSEAPSQGVSAREGIADIGSFGFADEARGKLADLFDKYGQSPEQLRARWDAFKGLRFGELFDPSTAGLGDEANKGLGTEKADLTDQYRNLTESARVANPKTFYGAGLAAGALTGTGALRGLQAGALGGNVARAAQAVNAARGAVTVPARLAGVMGTGGLIGALSGAGAGEDTLESRAKSTIMGGAAGAAIPGALTGMGILGKALAPNALRNAAGTIGGWLGNVGQESKIGPAQEQALKILNQQMRGTPSGQLTPLANAARPGQASEEIIGDMLPGGLLTSEHGAIPAGKVLAGVQPQGKVAQDALAQLEARGAGRGGRVLGDVADSLRVEPKALDIAGKVKELDLEGQLGARPKYAEAWKAGYPLEVPEGPAAAALENQTIVNAVNRVSNAATDAPARWSIPSLRAAGDKLLSSQDQAQRLAGHAAHQAADQLEQAGPLAQQAAQLRHWLEHTDTGRGVWDRVKTIYNLGDDKLVQREAMTQPDIIERVAQVAGDAAYQQGKTGGELTVIKELHRLAQGAVNQSTGGKIEVARDIARAGKVRGEAVERGYSDATGPLGEEIKRLDMLKTARGQPLVPGIGAEVRQGVGQRVLPPIASAGPGEAVGLAQKTARGLDWQGVLPTTKAKDSLFGRLTSEAKMQDTELGLARGINAPLPPDSWLARATQAVAANNPVGGVQHTLGLVARRVMQVSPDVSEAYLGTLVRKGTDLKPLMRELARVKNMGQVGDVARAHMAEQAIREFLYKPAL